MPFHTHGAGYAEPVHGRKRWFLFEPAVACFALAAVPVYVLATPVAFGAGWAWPGLFNLSVVRRFPEAPGAATGATQTGTYLGAGVGPLVFGLVVDARGFSVAWPLAAVLLARADRRDRGSELAPAVALPTPGPV